MALVLKDRVKETTTTTGTGTYTLAGAVTGFEAFSSVGDGNTTYYSCTDGTDFEVGIGTYTASGTTLARTTILQSSNSDSAVSWSSGTKTIFCAQPAEKAVFVDASGDLTLTGANYNIVFDKSADALEFPDNAKATFGDSADGTIQHTGSNLQIFETTGGIQITNFANDLDVDIRTDDGSGGTALYFKADGSTGAAELYHYGTKKLETTADGVTITSTDAGADEKPTIKLFRDSSSPADSDEIGEIEFVGKNDANEDTTYFRVFTSLLDVSDGTEDSRLEFKGLSDGSETTYFQMKGAKNFSFRDLELTSGKKLVFEGSTSDNFETSLTVTDPTADRTITLPDATGTVLLTDGSGASLTSLNASQLSSGTVPNARLDAQLQDVAGLAVTNGGFIVGDGSNFVLETGSTARTSLGLGSSATADTGISNGNVAVFTSGAADNDFLRIDGTSVEGRSASEVLSDIGATTATAAADEATALAIALG